MLLKNYRCPSCKKPTSLDPANRFRPFCSERCKMIDLGEWASENYKIAAEPVMDDKDDTEQP